jgi:hypothetical protein
MAYDKYGFKIEVKRHKPGDNEVHQHHLYLYKDDNDALYVALKDKNNRLRQIPLAKKLQALTPEYPTLAKDLLNVIEDPRNKLQKKHIKGLLRITADLGYTGIYENFRNGFVKLQEFLLTIKTEEEFTNAMNGMDIQAYDITHSINVLPMPDVVNEEERKPIERLNKTYTKNAQQASWNIATISLLSTNENLGREPITYLLNPFNNAKKALLKASNKYLSAIAQPHIINDDTYKLGLAYREFLMEMVDDPALKALRDFAEQYGEDVGPPPQTCLKILETKLATYKAHTVDGIEETRQLLASRDQRIKDWTARKEAIVARLNEDAIPADDSLEAIGLAIKAKQALIDEINATIDAFENLSLPLCTSAYTQHLAIRPAPDADADDYSAWRVKGVLIWRNMFHGNTVFLECATVWSPTDPVKLDVKKLAKLAPHSPRAWIRYQNCLYFANKEDNTLTLLTNHPDRIKEFDELLQELPRQAGDEKSQYVLIKDSALLRQLTTITKQSFVVDENQSEALTPFFADARVNCTALKEHALRLEQELVKLQAQHADLMERQEEADAEKVSDDGLDNLTDEDIEPLEEPGQIKVGFMRRVYRQTRASINPTGVHAMLLELETKQAAIAVSVAEMKKILTASKTQDNPLMYLKAHQALYEGINRSLVEQRSKYQAFIELLTQQPEEVQQELTARIATWLNEWGRMQDITDYYPRRIENIEHKKFLVQLRKIANASERLIKQFESPNKKQVKAQDVKEQLDHIEKFIRDNDDPKKDLTTLKGLQKQVQAIDGKLEEYKQKRKQLTISFFGSSLDQGIDLKNIPRQNKSNATFIKYLNERNKTYAMRDWFSVNLAMFLGCFGYTSERLEREKYLIELRTLTIAYKNDPTEDNYIALSECIEEGLTKPAMIRATFFSPRAKVNEPNYANSLQSKLLLFKAKLAEVEDVIKDKKQEEVRIEVDDQHQAPLPG